MICMFAFFKLKMTCKITAGIIIVKKISCTVLRKEKIHYLERNKRQVSFDLSLGTLTTPLKNH